jgi:hypothetical protein
MTKLAIIRNGAALLSLMLACSAFAASADPNGRQHSYLDREHDSRVIERMPAEEWGPMNRRNGAHEDDMFGNVDLRLPPSAHGS